MTFLMFVKLIYLIALDVARVRQPQQRVGLVVVKSGVAFRARIIGHQFRDLLVWIANIEFDVVEAGRRTHDLVGKHFLPLVP